MILSRENIICKRVHYRLKDLSRKIILQGWRKGTLYCLLDLTLIKIAPATRTHDIYSLDIVHFTRGESGRIFDESNFPRYGRI